MIRDFRMEQPWTFPGRDGILPLLKNHSARVFRKSGRRFCDQNTRKS
jgi:hypothetical protein